MRPAGPNVAAVAALIGDPVRALMLFALLDGREFSASELALCSGASPQAASGHLKKLVEGGLLTARPAGRRRLFQIACTEVATAIETLASIAPRTPIVSLGQHTALQRLREARSCYDHLAGRLGVRLTDALVERKALKAAGREFEVTSAGVEIFRSLGVDVARANRTQRQLARVCIDWTERRPHLAGTLGAALLEAVLRSGWVERIHRDRSLHVTAAGRSAFARVFGVD
jgi:DNA-binding transcriptional ArsR family regulator